MKNQVSGVAGAARLKNVNRAGLARAEKHGKRLDQTGQSRAINEVRPVTNTGLDLQTLYDKHVEGVFVPSAKSSAMHLLIQWPTELVDGKNADYMLHHARAFAESVFGVEAIFADRLDRDENSQHVVDLFLAPRYTKTTKRESKPATSTTHHLKALAKKYGEKPLPFGYGRALQTALHEYMRDEMQLDGVERGKAKAVSGKDWKSVEQQRADRLDDLIARANGERERLEQKQARVHAAEGEATRRIAEREEVLVVRERQAAEREQAIAAREIETAAINAAATAAREATDVARVRLDAALDAAERNSAKIERDRVAIGRERSDAEADRAEAATERAGMAAGRERIDAQRRLQEAQLALLARAMEDDAGLELHRTSVAFSMRKEAMRPDERLAYETGWSKSLMRVARQIAKMLEQARAWTRRLRAREQVIEDREAALAARNRDAEREREVRQAEHATALLALHHRDRELAAREQAAATRMADADARIAAAAGKDAAAQALLTRHSGWATAVDTLIEHPEWIDVTGTIVRLDRNTAASADPKLVATLGEQPPAWALKVIFARLDVADQQSRVDEFEQAAIASAAQLTDLIARVTPMLNPEQQKVVTESQQAIRRSSATARAWNAAQGNGR